MMVIRLRSLLLPLAHACHVGLLPARIPRAAPLGRQAGCCCVLALQMGAAGAQEPAPQPAAVVVTSVEVQGNTLLPPPTLQALTAGLAGGSRTLAELNAVAARVQDAYRDAGYGGVVAYVPEQAAPGGHVVIRVVEGKLAQVRITGNRYFDAANVRAGLPSLVEGATPRVADVDRDIQLSNDNPAKNVKVTLTAGARPGDIDADVSVTETNPLQYLVGYNNTGNHSTGRHRVSVGLQHANLFGRDHVGTLQYQTSPEDPGRVKIFSAGYRVPLYPYAASLDAFVAHSSVSNGTTITPAGPLSFTGRGTVAGLRANRNLDRIGEYDHHVTLGLDWRKYDDDCAIGDFGPAACGSAAVDVATIPLVLAYTGQKQGPQLAYGLSAALSVNAGGSARATFEAARPGATRNYAIARGAGFVDRAFAAGFSVNARADLQYSPHALISGERFGLGGAASVRGYAERELSGDAGLLVRLEIAPNPVELAGGWRVRPYLFVDHGRIVNHHDLPCRGTDRTACQLTGAGIGARVGLGRKVNASIDLGRALERGINTAPGDVRGHVALNLIF
ncbi:ShlB/FhaC/HecB family hemolysin secretion/activation protein [[Empedobacter] haloabium]|uniref:ShlB/FhaC/HecB family hemolysin secretion/activation protein n=1 Tax=[Empedobacter] haloabium TaxID=592317 RepID=A0ABZ1UFV1_9BURK